MRFLLCSFSTPGLLFPLVGMALELRRRGHEVAFATGLAAGPVLEAAGLARLPRGERDGDSFHVQAWYDPLPNAIDAKHVEHALRLFPADALVTHHLCLSALVVGERQGIPVAVMGSFTYLFPPARPYPRSVESEARVQWRLTEETRSLNAVRTLFRLPPRAPDPADPGLLGDLFLLRTTPAVERELDALPRRVHAAGPCVWEPEPAPGAWEALEAELAAPGAPLLYVHSGRTFDGPAFWPQLVEGVAGMPVQVVASVGRMDGEVGALPPNVLARGHVPQGVVFPRARAVLAGGHSTVVIGAATHGLPSVLIPHGVETPDNAERLADAGSALRLDAAAVTPAIVREAVERVLADAELRRNSRILQASLRSMEGFGHAAALVETLAATRAPVLRPVPVPEWASAPMAGTV